MSSEYDLAWVVVSVGMAIFAAYTALGLAAHVAHAEKRTAPYWIAGSAFTMGVGVWSMHFVGMLAFRLPIPVSYDSSLTLASVVLAMVSSGLAFTVLRRDHCREPMPLLPSPSMWLAALLMGGGIAGMHYTGMAAMSMQPPIQYDPLLFSLSIGIAVVASGVALRLFSFLRDESRRFHQRLKVASAVLMGFAIAGMHYTGMAAARFDPDSICHAAAGQIDSNLLAVLTGVGSVLVLSFALGISIVDRYRGLQAFYQALMNARNARGEGILVVERQRFVYANDSACRWLGRTTDEALAAPSAIDLLHEFDWQAAPEVWSAIGAGYWPESQCELVVKRDGRVLSLTIMPFAYRDDRRYLLTLHDISARKRLENLQKEREDFLRRVLYQQHVATLVIDAEHRVISWNRRCEELTGVREADILGKAEAWRGFYAQAQPCAANLILLRSKQDAASGLRIENWFSNADGQRRYLIVEAAPIIDAAGEITAVIETLSDVTHMKQVEEALEDAKQRAETANRAKSQFLANMSHEIRTPLNGVLGMAQLLMLPDLTEAERLDYAKTIVVSGEALLTILNDILDLSKIEAGKLEIIPEVMRPAQVVRDVAALFAESARQKDLYLNLELSDELERPVRSDPIRIRQVLSNLLGNAVKFTQQGGITLRASLQPCPDTANIARLCIEVIDSGIGITLEAQQRLFQRFSQADSSDTRHYGGTGLGLVICKEFCQLLGGDIGVESRLGQGSTFWFTVQTTYADDSKLIRPLYIAENDQFDAGAYTVLIVEDNPINLKLAQAMLAHMGYRFDCAHNGAEAVEAYGRNRYDVILMDCHMPTLSGWEATEQIRRFEQQYERRRVPIVALSASAYGEDLERCLACGMDEFLGKPFNRHALAQILRKCLQQT